MTRQHVGVLQDLPDSVPAIGVPRHQLEVAARLDRRQLTRVLFEILPERQARRGARSDDETRLDTLDSLLPNLRSLFVTVCLEAPEELSEEEIRSVVEPMPEDGLRTLLGSLRRHLAGEPPERARIWCEKVHPWLRDYWPRAAVRNTAATSQAILELMVECGDAFPEAAGWSLEYLRPFEGRGLYRLGENGHAAQHPESMLRVLDRVVDADVLQGYEKHTLQEVLDALVGANVEMAQDPRFQRLYGIAIQ